MPCRVVGGGLRSPLFRAGFGERHDRNVQNLVGGVGQAGNLPVVRVRELHRDPHWHALREVQVRRDAALEQLIWMFQARPGRPLRVRPEGVALDLADRLGPASVDVVSESGSCLTHSREGSGNRFSFFVENE